MLDLHALKGQDLKALSPDELAALAARMLEHIDAQTQQIDQQSKHIGVLGLQVDSQAQGIKWRDAKIESITFQLAKLQAWRYGARAEAMTAEQRALFDETYAADEASLKQQLADLKGSTPEGDANQEAAKDKKRQQPKRKPLPEHLPRVEQRIEPENTTCPTPECGRPMVRVGEDVSERLDIIPAKFFVQRQIRGKWACRCCQLLVQEPAAAQVFDNAQPTPGLQAHVAVSHFVDHLPYYRISQIYDRAGVPTPRSTLAAWTGRTGGQLMPLAEAHRAFVLGSRILHADETPVPLLEPGAGKTKRAYMWTYARGAFDPVPGVVYDFCLGRGSKYPMAFLQGWSGTLVVDAYAAYDSVTAPQGRTAAFCLAHARRAFDELIKTSSAASPVAAEAVRRIAWLYKIEAEVRDLSIEERWRIRQERSKPLWDELHLWLQLERSRVPNGSAIAKAIDYSLTRWSGLSQFLLDGEVPIGRVEMWRGGSRLRHRCFRPFRLTVPYEPNRNSVSTSPSSNRTCGFPASGSLPTHQAFAFERPRLIGSRHISPNFW